MPDIRYQSAEEDRCSVHFGEHVAIYDLSRGDAEQIVATYIRQFGPSGEPAAQREPRAQRASRPNRQANRLTRAA
jgi:hypothetical protein